MGEKGRPWKKVVPEQQYRVVEAILFQYSEMVRAVAEWRESTIMVSRKTDDGMPRRHAHISDPTSLAAIRLENPPDSIANKIAWIDVVNDGLRTLKSQDEVEGTHLYDVCRAYYGIESLGYERRNKVAIIRDLAWKLHVDEMTVRHDKDLVVSKVWSVAVWKGMINPTEEN